MQSSRGTIDFQEVFRRFIAAPDGDNQNLFNATGFEMMDTISPLKMLKYNSPTKNEVSKYSTPRRNEVLKNSTPITNELSLKMPTKTVSDNKKNHDRTRTSGTSPDNTNSTKNCKKVKYECSADKTSNRPPEQHGCIGKGGQINTKRRRRRPRKIKIINSPEYINILNQKLTCNLIQQVGNDSQSEKLSIVEASSNVEILNASHETGSSSCKAGIIFNEQRTKTNSKSNFEQSFEELRDILASESPAAISTVMESEEWTNFEDYFNEEITMMQIESEIGPLLYCDELSQNASNVSVAKVHTIQEMRNSSNAYIPYKVLSTILEESVVSDTYDCLKKLHKPGSYMATLNSTLIQSDEWNLSIPGNEEINKTKNKPENDQLLCCDQTEPNSCNVPVQTVDNLEINSAVAEEILDEGSSNEIHEPSVQEVRDLAKAYMSSTLLSIIPEESEISNMSDCLYEEIMGMQKESDTSAQIPNSYPIETNLRNTREKSIGNKNENEAKVSIGTNFFLRRSKRIEEKTQGIQCGENIPKYHMKNGNNTTFIRSSSTYTTFERNGKSISNSSNKAVGAIDINSNKIIGNKINENIQSTHMHNLPTRRSKRIEEQMKGSVRFPSTKSINATNNNQDGNRKYAENRMQNSRYLRSNIKDKSSVDLPLITEKKNINHPVTNIYKESPLKIAEPNFVPRTSQRMKDKACAKDKISRTHRLISPTVMHVNISVSLSNRSLVKFDSTQHNHVKTKQKISKIQIDKNFSLRRSKRIKEKEKTK